MIEIKNKTEFDEALKSAEKVIVKIGAPWCGPCKVVAENINKLEKGDTEVKFFEIDVDEADEDFVATFNVRNVPVLIGYINGEEIKRTVGLQTVENLKNYFN